jgi:thiamine-monophosphate kinase
VANGGRNPREEGQPDKMRSKEVRPEETRSEEARIGEDEIIARFLAPIAGLGGFGLRDDAALLAPPPGTQLVLTVDALVAGVHFFVDDPPEAIAAKALGVNLSDLAAKGAEPLGCLLSLALPVDWQPAWLQRLATGFGEAAAAGSCPLLGGDTVRTPGPLTLSVTAIGAVPSGSMVHRMGARAGDRIYVSGTIGDSALGLALRLAPDAPFAAGLTAAQHEHLLDRYLRPRPRLALAGALREFAHGAMDVSDGFVGDLTKLLASSQVSAEVELTALPLSCAAAAALLAQPSLIETIATGGDDYEILCTIPPAKAALFEAAAAHVGLPVTPVGHVLVPGAPPRFLLKGTPMTFTRSSFSHF